MKARKSFTLLELIAVIIIIGILAAVAWPHYLKMTERAREMEGINIASAVFQSEKRYEIENGNYTDEIVDLDVDIPSLKFFDDPVLQPSSDTCLVKIERNGEKAGNWNYVICVGKNGDFSYENSSNKGPMDFE